MISGKLIPSFPCKRESGLAILDFGWLLVARKSLKQLSAAVFLRQPFLKWSGWLLLLLAASSCRQLGLVPQRPTVVAGGVNSQRADVNPAYSSDGRYLAFASDRDRSRSVYLYDLQERRLVPLPNLNRINSSQEQPTLSADGRFIAYVSTERGKTDVLVYDRTTQRSELLTANLRGTVQNPSISGDGRFVAFETSQSGQWNIAIIDRGADNSAENPVAPVNESP